MGLEKPNTQTAHSSFTDDSLQQVSQTYMEE